jgi:hypothetical protein
VLLFLPASRVTRPRHGRRPSGRPFSYQDGGWSCNPTLLKSIPFIGSTMRTRRFNATVSAARRAEMVKPAPARKAIETAALMDGLAKLSPRHCVGRAPTRQIEDPAAAVHASAAARRRRRCRGGCTQRKAARELNANDATVTKIVPNGAIRPHASRRYRARHPGQASLSAMTGALSIPCRGTNVAF